MKEVIMRCIAPARPRSSPDWDPKNMKAHIERIVAAPRKPGVFFNFGFGPEITLSVGTKNTPPLRQHPAPRAQEWVFFDSALVGVFLFP